MKLLVYKTKESYPDLSKNNPSDIGWDITAQEVNYVYDKETGVLNYIEYDTGIAIKPVQYKLSWWKKLLGFKQTVYYVDVAPRSSLSKMWLIQANSIGLIDPNYVGTIKLRYKYSGPMVPGTGVNFEKVYKVGDKIAQLKVVEKPVEEIVYTYSPLTSEDRGTAGFGSTEEKNKSNATSNTT